MAIKIEIILTVVAVFGTMIEARKVRLADLQPKQTKPKIRLNDEVNQSSTTDKNLETVDKSLELPEFVDTNNSTQNELTAKKIELIDEIKDFLKTHVKMHDNDKLVENETQSRTGNTIEENLKIINDIRELLGTNLSRIDDADDNDRNQEFLNEHEDDKKEDVEINSIPSGHSRAQSDVNADLTETESYKPFTPNVLPNLVNVNPVLDIIGRSSEGLPRSIFRPAPDVGMYNPGFYNPNPWYQAFRNIINNVPFNIFNGRTPGYQTILPNQPNQQFPPILPIQPNQQFPPILPIQPNQQFPPILPIQPNQQFPPNILPIQPNQQFPHNILPVQPNQQFPPILSVQPNQQFPRVFQNPMQQEIGTGLKHRNGGSVNIDEHNAYPFSPVF